MNMQALQQDTLLKGGAYRIEKIIGRSDFEITYLSDKYGSDKNVVITEFFMKDLCGRDGNKMTYGTDVSNDVILARDKFKKEAENLKSQASQRVFDVFEENDTVYYVKEYEGDGAIDTVHDYSSKSDGSEHGKKETAKSSLLSKLKWPFIFIAVFGVAYYFMTSESTSKTENTVHSEKSEKKVEQRKEEKTVVKEKAVKVEKESAAFASLMEKMNKVKKDALSIPGVSQHKVLTELSNVKDEFEKNKSKLSADEQERFHKAFQEVIEIVKKRS